MVKLPRRSKRFGVGKEIGGAVYVHQQYEHLLPVDVIAAKRLLPATFIYSVIKFTIATRAVSFVSSPDFDAAPEPSLGDILSVATDGTATYRKQPADPYIYHHKWLFVADDYAGFNVAASKLRSAAWLALDGVDKTRIGRRSYWLANVVPRLSEPAWVNSQAACKQLRISACELSHLRIAGKLPFKKQGNAFLYRLPDRRIE